MGKIQSSHIQKLAAERALAAENARNHGSVIDLSRSAVNKEKKTHNRDVFKKLIRCVYNHLHVY